MTPNAPGSNPVETRTRLRAAARAGLVLLLAALALPAWAGPYTSVYFFGDSLTDTGNAFAATGLPQAPYVDGRITNGNNYADRLAQRLGLSATAAAVGGTNFAIATATAAPVPTPPGVPTIALADQVGAYSARVGFVDPQALYVFWFGSNDVRNALASPFDGATILASAINEMSQILSAFAALGARNFLVADVPSLALVPAVRALNDPLASFAADQATSQFNGALSTTLLQLSSQFSDARFAGMRTNQLFAQLLANPAAFGFTNVTDPCFTGSPLVPGSGTVCANPDAYLFWDDLHPSARAHQLLGDFAFSATVVPLPASSLLLAAGLVLFGFATRRRSPVH